MSTLGDEIRNLWCDVLADDGPTIEGLEALAVRAEGLEQERDAAYLAARELRVEVSGLERDAYKQAKAENDERFQLEAAAAKEQVARVRAFRDRLIASGHTVALAFAAEIDSALAGEG